MTASDTNSRSRIRQDRAVAGIEQLARRNPPQPEFFAEFLKVVRERFGATSVAIWSWAAGQLNLQSEAGFQATEFCGKPDLVEWQRRQLLATLDGDNGRVVSTSEVQTVLSAPQCDMLMAPLRAGSRKIGVVQVFCSDDEADGSSDKTIELLESLARVASGYLQRQLTPDTSTPRLQPDAFFRFSLKLQQCDRLTELGSIVVNDGCELLRADRITLIRKRRPTAAVLSVTGREQVNSRAPQIRDLKKLASAVLASGQTLRFGGHDETLPEEMERELMDYVQLSHARLLLMIPLRRPKPAQDSHESLAPVAADTIGCVMIERFDDDEPTPEMVHWIDQFINHVSAAMTLSLTHESILFLPLRRRLAAGRRWLQGRRLLITLAAAGAAFAALAMLLFGEWKYRVEGTGRLMPVARSEIFAPEDADVVAIHVNDGEQVAAGQRLVQLSSDELEAAYVAAANEVLEQQQRLLSIRAELDNAKEHARRDEAIRLQGEAVQTQIAIAAAEEHRAVLESRRNQLEVRSPLAGTVSTFQVEQLLRDRPIRRGDLLLEVMHVQGDWRLELEVPEHRMGHLLQGQKLRADRQLPIDFLLVTAPETTYAGALQDVATRAVSSVDGGNVVEVFATFDKNTVPELRIGAEVRAHIDCGKSPIGYVLFGDIIEFVRMNLWY